MFDFQESLLWLGKLFLAALLGGLIGFERESHGQAAGLRTNLLVALASCLLMMLSLRMADIFKPLDATSFLRVDPGRIASYAVAGMGFLGGGAIIKGRGTVRGLTTAAGLWLVTGIGLSVGAGYILPAVYTTAISLLILYNLAFLKLSFSHDVYTILSITCFHSNSTLKVIRKVLGSFDDIEIRFINYEYEVSEQKVTYRIRLCGKEDRKSVV